LTFSPENIHRHKIPKLKNGCPSISPNFHPSWPIPPGDCPKFAVPPTPGGIDDGNGKNTANDQRSSPIPTTGPTNPNRRRRYGGGGKDQQLTRPHPLHWELGGSYQEKRGRWIKKLKNLFINKMSR
jgi:hypothetical protein